jgi:fimbrial isopeptide formation D2 family protein
MLSAGTYVLTVTAPSTVSLTAAAGTVCYSGTTTLSVSTPANAIGGYTWDSSTDGTTWWTSAAGNSNSFTTGALTHTTYFRVAVSTSDVSCPTVLSNVVTVTVNDVLPNLTCVMYNDPVISIEHAKCDTTIMDVATLDHYGHITNSQYSQCYTLTNNWTSSASLVGAVFPIGTHTITWTVTAGTFTDACSRVLTVLDRHAPDIVCKDVILALDGSGAASITAKGLVDPVNDCSTPLTYEFSTGETELHYGCDDIGTYTLTVKVTDAANNSSTCTARVEVKDDLSPTITVNPMVAVRVGEAVTPAQVIVALSDNCTAEAYMLDPANNLIRFEPSATYSCGDMGSSPATVYVKDAAGNEASATFTVQVEEMKPAYEPLPPYTVRGCDPADILPANTGEITFADVTVCGSAAITYTDASTRGTDKTQADYYNYDITRTWTVSAGAGNDSTTQQVISVRDIAPPVIVPESSGTVYIGQNGKGTPEADKVLRSVTDCADSVDVSIDYSPSEFTCNDIGTPQAITITGRDPSGNVSTVTATVNVLDILPPVITVINPVTLMLDASGTVTLTQSQVLGTLSDNCTESSEIVVTFDRNVFYTDDMKDNPIPVQVCAADQWGNMACVEVLVILVDDMMRETTITKRIQGRDVANQGDTVTFIITVTNKFGGDHDIVIVDSLPAGLSLVEDRVPSNASVDLTRKVVTINHGALGEGETVSYAIVARVERPGMWTNYAYLERAGKRIDEAVATLNALLPELTLTAKIREGDYTNVEVSPSTYNVPSTYRMVTTLENKGGATVDRIDVQIHYDPFIQRFAGSSRGAEVTDYGNGVLIWTVYNFEGNFKVDLELTFIPLIAVTYTFVNEIMTQLPYEDPSDNVALVTVNQAIIDVPNVVTSDHPELHIRGLNNFAIEEVVMKTVNIWGNQVYYAHHRKGDIEEDTCWFDAGSLARGTYWYELVIRYQNGSSYVIRDYVEVLK